MRPAWDVLLTWSHQHLYLLCIERSVLPRAWLKSTIIGNDVCCFTTAIHVRAKVLSIFNFLASYHTPLMNYISIIRLLLHQSTIWYGGLQIFLLAFLTRCFYQISSNTKTLIYTLSINHESFDKQLFLWYSLEHKKRHKVQLNTAARVAQKSYKKWTK